MLTRREFLGASSVAVLGGAGRVPAPEPQQGCEDLPPSIAQLASLRDQVRPITAAERETRVERARQLMRQQGIDALMLTGGTSLVYFTNIRWDISERLLAVVVPVAGRPFVVSPAFEEDRAREQLATGPLRGADTEVLAWQEDESPSALVAKGLGARGLATGTLGVEETVRYVFSDGIAQAAPALRIRSGTPLTAGCRGAKDAHELELMRLASQVTLTAYAAASRALTEGMTQQRFGDLVGAAHRKLGFAGGASVQVGEYSALPHGSATPQRIREGAILLIDGGCAVEGYRSDLSRTFVLGNPTPKMRTVFDIVRRAQDAAVRTARPGLPCEAVDSAARQVIEQAGYGPGYAYFTHRVGHGLGMDGHEWPYLVRGNTLPLAPRMTFSDEPGIYIRGEFGVRLEDDMVITETGAELLTPQSASLERPF
jgi:Xaa-Pro dipeptidase